MPAGGIARVRSLRTTFSHTAASWPTFSRLILSSVSPAVANFSLWHATQYLSRSARFVNDDCPTDLAGGKAAFWDCGLADAQMANTIPVQTKILRGTASPTKMVSLALWTRISRLVSRSLSIIHPTAAVRAVASSFG